MGVNFNCFVKSLFPHQISTPDLIFETYEVVNSILFCVPTMYTSIDVYFCQDFDEFMEVIGSVEDFWIKAGTLPTKASALKKIV